MFCYQCEQTAKGTGCTRAGVCGKDDTTAALQDVMIYQSKGVAAILHRARALGAVDREADRALTAALFTTVTNVNFDPARLEGEILALDRVRDRALALYRSACGKAGVPVAELPPPADFQPADGVEALVRQGQAIGILNRMHDLGDDVTGLQELLTYGLKGMAAYADHAAILGIEDDEVYAFFEASLSYLADNPSDVGELIGWCLRCGEVNLRVMEMLDEANTGTYGHPEPTAVRVEPVKGKAICVSGHDLKDLKTLLEQTEGTGINVYTHGEMLPCLAYPELKKHKHLKGNYGGAWQDQAKEFDAFPGAILMTTNCIQRPRPSYQARIFTTGLVAWPDVTHIEADEQGYKDFTPVIEAAKAAPGFAEDGPDKTIMIGFARNAVLGVADKVIDAVKAGAIRHFYLIGGCDGAKPGRNYYTEFSQAVPEDCVILTLACGKYRFNKLEFGDIGGIPRLLDVGQCNDAYSAIRIAAALADAFGCGVNDLPLSMILSWYEQKAVVILLTLLHLGIQNIRLGPTLPAFVTPAVLQVLVDKFQIKPTGTVEEDLAATLAG
jgi:hydroxylamine reductase